MPEFRAFPKIPRLEKFLTSPVTVTEKLDGTNGCIVIRPTERFPELTGAPPLALFDNPDVAAGGYLGIWAQSRKRILAVDNDNYGFANWVKDHAQELLKLSHGYHFGEWWGNGIQRGYGLDKDDKRFSLFNVNRPVETLPDVPGLGLVPVIDQHTYDPEHIKAVGDLLLTTGSVAAPGYDKPEGIMIWHSNIRQYFKMPFDPKPKGEG